LGERFFLASADAAQGEKQQREVLGALLHSPEAADSIGRFFFDKTRELVAAASYSQVGGKTSSVDIVRDVLKYVPLYWAATELVSPCSESLFLGAVLSCVSSRLVSSLRATSTRMAVTRRKICFPCSLTSTRKFSEDGAVGKRESLN
jgi:hypothetical protein